MTGVPARALAMAEFPPVEDVILPVLREAFPDIPVHSLIPQETDAFPFILVRSEPSPGFWGGNADFVERTMVAIHVFTEDPNGDEEGALLSDAVRVAMRDSVRKPRPPGAESLRRVVLTQRPRRVTDWATASGPVQYADMPTGTWRYESIYRITYRRPGT